MGNSTPCKIATPENIIFKLRIRDYVGEMTHHANFGFNRCSRGFSPMKRYVEIRQQLCLKETVTDRVRKRRLTWFGHVTRMCGNRLPLKALHCYIRGNRSRGRQRKKCNEDLTTATVLARDRSRWRRLVESRNLIVSIADGREEREMSIGPELMKLNFCRFIRVMNDGPYTLL